MANTTTPTTRAARPALTLDHVWLAVALVLLALRPLLTPIPPNDFWWHMETGRLIVESGQVPTVDRFSYTRAGEPFYNQGWLAQVILFVLHQAGGLPLLLLVQALVIVLAYGLLLRLCIRRSGRLRLGVALLLLTTLPLSFDNWNVRPQSYALPLFAAFLTIVSEFRLRQSNRLWLLPLLMSLWVNLHGSFVLGLALLALTLVGEWLKLFRPAPVEQAGQPAGSPVVSRQYLLWSLLTGAALLLNPRGVAVLGYVRDLLGTNAVTTLVTEWAPPTIRDTNGQIFFLFLLGCGLALTYARRRPDLTDLLLFGAFLWLALGATRSIIWFGMVATPLLVLQVATMLPPPQPSLPGSSALNGLLVGLMLFLLLLGLPWIKPALWPPEVGALLTPETPVAAVRAMRAMPQRPAHLFHEMGYGAYLIWAAPDQPVFIDPRIELYPYEQWLDYINLSSANNIAELVRRYGIDGMLLSKEDQEPLITALRGSREWVLRYEDAETVYFTR